ncbi:MAG TPA: hypothetical protein VK993_04780 [Chthoniobacterales bacterium]|nr:hypothetical protein [Chthoniobacterales bacterium]
MTNFISAAFSFRHPKTINSVRLSRVQALDETISQKRALLARQRQRLRGQFFDRHRLTLHQA